MFILNFNWFTVSIFMNLPLPNQLIGSWCLGTGLGDMDGWNGDNTIYIFSAGILFSISQIAISAVTNCFTFFFIFTFSQQDSWKVIFFLFYLLNLLAASNVHVYSQAGSLQLVPVSVEITYGLERILMLLQVWIQKFQYNHHLLHWLHNLVDAFIYKIVIFLTGCWSFQKNYVCWGHNLRGTIFGEWVCEQVLYSHRIRIRSRRLWLYFILCLIVALFDIDCKIKMLFLQEGNECILLGTCKCGAYSEKFWDFWARSLLSSFFGSCNSSVGFSFRSREFIDVLYFLCIKFCY